MRNASVLLLLLLAAAAAACTAAAATAAPPPCEPLHPDQRNRLAELLRARLTATAGPEHDRRRAAATAAADKHRLRAEAEAEAQEAAAAVAAAAAGLHALGAVPSELAAPACARVAALMKQQQQEQSAHATAPSDDAAAARGSRSARVRLLHHTVAAAAALGCPQTLTEEQREMLVRVVTDAAGSGSTVAPRTTYEAIVALARARSTTSTAGADATATGSSGAFADAVLAEAAARAALGIDRDGDTFGLGIAALGELATSGALRDATLIRAREHAEDVVAQALEAPTTLQLESGLTATALALRGMFAIAAAMKQAPPLSAEHVTKFVNYLGRSVYTTDVGDAAHMLVGLRAVTGNPFYVPVCVAPASTSLLLGQEASRVRVVVVDALGRALEAITRIMLVRALNADGAEVVGKQAMTPVGNSKSDYEFNLVGALGAAAVPGIYAVEIAAEGRAPPLIVSEPSVIVVSLAVRAVLSNATVSVVDAASGASVRRVPLRYPHSLAQPITVDHFQRLELRAAMQGPSGVPLPAVHQAFLRFVHRVHGLEVVVPATERMRDGEVAVAMDMATYAPRFGQVDGSYDVFLLVGDAALGESWIWHIGAVTLVFVTPQPYRGRAALAYTSPLPAVTYKLREPDARPSATLALLFTALAPLPLALLLISWWYAGANLRGYRLSVSSLLFHAGIGGMLLVLVLFWLRLNIFQAFYWLAGIGSATYFAGHYTLSARARGRLAAGTAR